jgi:hypothetical protein
MTDQLIAPLIPPASGPAHRRLFPGALVFGARAGARLAPGLLQHCLPLAGQQAGGMASALAQQRASLKAEPTQAKPQSTV